MKIIITESQYRMLLESNFEPIQNLIDMAFEDLKENCENYSIDSYNYPYLNNNIKSTKNEWGSYNIIQA